MSPPTKRDRSLATTSLGELNRWIGSNPSDDQESHESTLARIHAPPTPIELAKLEAYARARRAHEILGTEAPSGGAKSAARTALTAMKPVVSTAKPLLDAAGVAKSFTSAVPVLGEVITLLVGVFAQVGVSNTINTIEAMHAVDTLVARGRLACSCPIGSLSLPEMDLDNTNRDFPYGPMAYVTPTYLVPSNNSTELKSSLDPADRFKYTEFDWVDREVRMHRKLYNEKEERVEKDSGFREDCVGILAYAKHQKVTKLRNNAVLNPFTAAYRKYKGLASWVEKGEMLGVERANIATELFYRAGLLQCPVAIAIVGCLFVNSEGIPVDSLPKPNLHKQLAAELYGKNGVVAINLKLKSN